MIARRVETFDEWRTAARELLRAHVPPGDVTWQTAGDDQDLLFEPSPLPPSGKQTLSIPKQFFDVAELVSMHSDPARWSLLYRVAWRLTHGERNLLHIEVDPDIRELAHFRKAVEHDRYKMRAFVRFRKVVTDGEEQFIAWYDPAHRTLLANSKFFIDRFGGMRWAILTPYLSMYWDLQQLHTGPGVPRSQAPPEDVLEELWRTYYKSIYNPARLNLDAMRAQLPVFRWVDLPESRVIPELVRGSRGRVHTMAANQPKSALEFVPQPATLPVLREAVQQCRACDLCPRASQAVFGEGPESARIVLVGEQPGDEEDLSGRPFVGPAGKVLDEAIKQAGLDRAQLYLTNAVKAFKFEPRGKRRIHQTPRAPDISTCRPWLLAELTSVKPDVIVCLGASAGQSVFGRVVRVGAERGRLHPHHLAKSACITYHPSSILRAPDEQMKQEQFSLLVADLALAGESVARAA